MHRIRENSYKHSRIRQGANDERKKEIEKQTEVMNKELEVLNDKFMKKYEGDTASLRIMQEFVGNYECPEK